jgi:predicted anti-sigma-YlaC factor YlaD
MNCQDVVSRLDELVDDALPAQEAAVVRDHLEACAACRGELQEIRGLLEQVRGLPDEIEPERDLWPGIAARLESRRPARRSTIVSWPQALGAAAALLMAVAVVIGLVVAPGEAPLDVVEAPPSAPTTVASAALDGGQAEVDSVRARLHAVFLERREQLSPETAAVVNGSLKVLEASIQGLKSAVDANPDNPRLVRMLADAYQREINLLRQATRLPEGA